MDYTTARKLRDSLMQHHQLSDFHSISPADLAVRVSHEAGLHTAYIPLAKTARKDCRIFEMHLALVDPSPLNRLDLASRGEQPTLVYALVPLKPMTDYLGELHQCCLTQLWWSAPSFFGAVASIIAPSWRRYSDHERGRSHWGDQDRAAMDRAFGEFWTPQSSIEPTAPVPPGRVAFANIPTLPLPTTSPS